MPNLTTISSSEKLPWAIYNLFFDTLRPLYNGQEITPHIVTLRNGKGTIKKVQVGDFIYLEQNPHSTSKYGALARRGKKILWIIHALTGAYVGNVIEGAVSKL